MHSVYALLIAEDRAITEFLGDCETPAHTEWNERSEGFKDKYENAARTLRFIKNSVKEIVSLLDQPPAERQTDFLKDIFFVPERMKEEQDTTTTKPKIPKIKSKPQMFNIEMIRDGFKALGTEAIRNKSMPVKAVIKIAYDVRKENPFKQYEKFDFDLTDNNFNVVSVDCSIRERNENRIKVEISNPDFSLNETQV